MKLKTPLTTLAAVMVTGSLLCAGHAAAFAASRLPSGVGSLAAEPPTPAPTPSPAPNPGSPAPAPPTPPSQPSNPSPTPEPPSQPPSQPSSPSTPPPPANSPAPAPTPGPGGTAPPPAGGAAGEPAPGAGDAAGGAAPAAPAAPAPRRKAPVPVGPGGTEAIAGLQALARGDLIEARAHFDKALALDPDNQIAHSRIAFLQFKKGDFPAAAAEAEIAVRLDPNDSLSYLVLGRSRDAMGDRAKAMAAYTGAIDATPNAKSGERIVSCALALYSRGMEKSRAGDAAGALEDFKGVLKVYPKNAYAHYEYALCQLKLGQTAEAYDSLKLSADALPTFQPQETWVYPTRRYLFLDENIHYWEGVALQKLGRNQEAVALLDPLVPKVESFAGSTMTKQYSTASAALEGTVENSFYNVHYPDALAYSALGDKTKALALLKSMLRIGLADEETQKLAKDLQKQIK